MGSVFEPGPATNCDTTTSSQDKVNASSQPERMAGRINGSVMRKNTLAGRAPRSSAASSSESSKVASRDCTTTVTEAIVKVTWAMMMVTMPRSNCQWNRIRNSCSRDTNSSSMDRPVSTSGMTSGAVVRPCSSARPRKGPNLASTRPAIVPSTTAPLAVMAAIRMDSQAACSTGRSWNSAAYQRSVGELAASHTVTSRELLKEYTIIEKIGAYRNSSPSSSATFGKVRYFFIALLFIFCG